MALAAALGSGTAGMAHETSTTPRWSLAIHGGAGTLERKDMTPEKDAAYRQALQAALDAAGLHILPGAIDAGGDYVAPGLVEMHTDNMEKHFMPRPKVFWPNGLAAALVHDAQMASAGVTTVYDAICAGTPFSAKDYRKDIFADPKLQEAFKAKTGRDLAVPLAQLEGIGVDEETQEAIEDWHYWVARGYEF